ncbi:mRNA triphosphatase CET1 [Radiomyces spectabilis]|uniref:mRNA triphosphatase CET1 n=1 Tax=Radiomyces spectabilis TaxID=64574 RepID=UPI00221F0615|nr:mRNA triphosphatase CET1 [Radiomyces spectabilis]KAI8368186.1 mRNA triphosphatase CET1 [Radiomyces spectabilis]
MSDPSNSQKRSREAEEQPARKQARHTNTLQEPTIFGVKPLDDIVRYIGDFIWDHCARENVEIEAKLGVFVDKRTHRRIDIGAKTETVLTDCRSVRFESDMPLEQHRHFNKMLNDLVNKTQARDYKGERIRYKHTKETDRFYEGGRSRIRVTTDQQTGQIVPNGIIEKIRIADLNIHSPMQPLDYRISINIEMPRNKPTNMPNYERNKDRLSYQHGGFNFDLTQVKGAPNKDEDMRHELELEFIDAKSLATEKQKMERREASHYLQMVESFVNNIRLLSQNAQRLA